MYLSDKSPLFISSLELLAHATEIYTQNNQKKFKFIILHLANAIELILKDRMIDKGISIYCKGGSQTISIWKAFDDLEQQGIIICERPIIEILIDDRNTIQHRFGFPNGDCVYYYLENVVGFFKRFLDEEYSVNLAEALETHLSKENIKFLGLINDNPKGDGEKVILEQLMKISPKSAVLEIYNLIQNEFSEIISPFDMSNIIAKRPIIKNPFLGKLLFMMEQDGYANKGIKGKFIKLQEGRNRAAHSSINDIDKIDWNEFVTYGYEILTAFKKVNKEKYLNKDRYDKLVNATPAELNENQ